MEEEVLRAGLREAKRAVGEVKVAQAVATAVDGEEASVVDTAGAKAAVTRVALTMAVMRAVMKPWPQL